MSVFAIMNKQREIYHNMLIESTIGEAQLFVAYLIAAWKEKGSKIVFVS